MEVLHTVFHRALVGADFVLAALEQHLAADRADGRTQDQRVRIGFYSYAAPMVGAATPEPAPAPP